MSDPPISRGFRGRHTPAGLWLDMRGASRLFVAAVEA
jgi:hypothetical protein